jgi:hypothetical protein
LVFNFQLPTTPNSCKKEWKGVIEDSSMNNNTKRKREQREEKSINANHLICEIREQMKRKTIAQRGKLSNVKRRVVGKKGK